MIAENSILKLCKKVGSIMLSSGAETFRVEDTVERIGQAYGFSIVCYSTLTAIFISLDSDTIVVKPKFGDYNLVAVDKINRLSRKASNGELTFDQFCKEINLLTTGNMSKGVEILAAGAVSMAPMFVFNGAWSDIFLSFFVGICGFVASKYVHRFQSVPFISEVVGGFIIGLLATVLVKYHVGIDTYTIVVSSIMPLVPGVAITNAIREIIAREIISGIVRMTNAFFVAGAIGFGVMLAFEV